MKKTKFFLVFLLFFLALPVATKAAETRSGDSIYVPKDQVIEGNFYAVGKTVTLEGDVNGDVVCLGSENITINSKILGDVLCAGDTININGEVLGNVRLAGKNININGTVGRNLNILASSFILGSNAKVGWDTVFASEQAQIGGQITGYLQGATTDLNISGSVGKNVDVHLGKSGAKTNPLVLGGQAKINGDLIYYSPLAGELNKDKVAGQIIHRVPQKDKDFALGWLWKKIIGIFSALIIGLILVTFWKKPLLELLSKMKSNWKKMFGWGVILLFLTPVICLFLLITIIGIPLALIILILWLLALFLVKILVAIFAGQLIWLKVFKKTETEKFLLEMSIGIIVCWFLFAIPIVGPLLSFVALLFGFGALWQLAKKS